MKSRRLDWLTHALSPCRWRAWNISLRASETQREAPQVMKCHGRQMLIATSVAIATCLVPFRHVYGYVDPGSGGYLLQITVAALFGALFTIRVLWGRIKGLWSKMTIASFRRKHDPGER